MEITVAEFTKQQLQEADIELTQAQFNKLMDALEKADLQIFYTRDSLVGFIIQEATKLVNPPTIDTWASHVNCKKADDLQLQLQQAESNLKMAREYMLKAEKDIQELKQKIQKTSPTPSPVAEKPKNHQRRHRGGRKHRAKKAAVEANKVVVATRRN